MTKNLAVTETAVAGCGNPNNTRRTAASCGIFFVRCERARLSFLGRAGRGQLRLGRLPCVPVFHPRRLARHPSRGNERRASNLHTEAAMPNAFARPEQTAFPQILAIVRAALRDAVAAPDDRASLDVAGAALVAVAAIAKAEVAHG